MNRETFSNGKLVERRDAVGTTWVIKDAEGVKIGEEPLNEEELARFQAEGQPTLKETTLADIAAASTIADLKAALTKWIGG